MRILLAACLLIPFSVNATEFENSKPWTTERKLTQNRMIRLHWVHEYEGFEILTLRYNLRPFDELAHISAFNFRIFCCIDALKILPKELHRKPQIKLARLGAVTSMQDFQEIRGNRFEKLKGDRKGQCSIRINDQYRICFRWENENVLDVEIVDYH